MQQSDMWSCWIHPREDRLAGPGPARAAESSLGWDETAGRGVCTNFLQMLAVTFLTPLAWYAEYPGFAHFLNWDGKLYDLAFKGDKFPHNDTANYLPGGAIMPMNIAKDLCALDSVCDSAGASGKIFRQMNKTTVYDMYLTINASVIMGTPMCHNEDGGLYQPSTKWVCCDNDIIDGILTTFALPPNLLHTSCTTNPDCVGFRVKNDGSGGDLIRQTVHSPGCFQRQPPSRENYGPQLHV